MDCPCNSGKEFDKCCKIVFKFLKIDDNQFQKETLLLAWQEKYSGPISESFYSKTKKYIYQLSVYLDSFVDVYTPLCFDNTNEQQTDIEKIYFNIKHNILLTLFGSLTCLSQGLFLQSGILQRSFFEDCFVLCDLALNEEQQNNILCDKYSTKNLITRIKPYLPSMLIDWYGYFSSNFAHFGPFHPAPYVPRKCYSDNWVIINGLQNLFFSISAYHIILERIYINATTNQYFWNRSAESKIIFNDENIIFAWMERLKGEVLIAFPKKQEGFQYSEKTYNFKYRKR